MEITEFNPSERKRKGKTKISVILFKDQDADALEEELWSMGGYNGAADSAAVRT